MSGASARLRRPALAAVGLAARVLARPAAPPAPAIGPPGGPTALPQPRAADPAGRPRLLVVRPDHLGDLLLATAVLGELRRRRPEAEIWALIGPWSAPILAGNPDVDRVLTYSFPWFDRRPLPPPLERHLAAAALASRLRPLGFAEAVVLRPDHWWGAMALALAGVPTLVGYAHPEAAPFLTRPRPPPGREHAVVSGLRLVAGPAAAAAAVPGRPATRFPVSPAARRAAAGLLAALGRPAAAGPGYALLHPGASSAVKRWPAERWARVADWLAERGRPVVLAAGPGEEGELAAIQAHARRDHAVLPRPPSLEELAGLLAGATLALGVDSAPMHLATAVGTPTLRLFGPGDEVLFGPWGAPDRHRALRAPGTAPDPGWFGRAGGPHPSLLALPVEQVLAELTSMDR